MNHELTIEGATAAHVDAAIALLAPTGQWRGIHLYKDVDKAHDWRQCQSTWHMWSALKTPGVVDPEAVIRTYELPGRCLVVFLDGQELYLDHPRPQIGDPLDALADALAELLAARPDREAATATAASVEASLAEGASVPLDELLAELLAAASTDATGTASTTETEAKMQRGALRLEKRPEWPGNLETLKKWEKLCEDRTQEIAAGLVGVSERTLRSWRRRRDELRRQE